MSESQSRYSIVERLTDKKLEIMRAKAELDSDIKEKEQEITETKKRKEDYGTDSKEAVERETRKLSRDIEKAERNHKNAVDRKDSRTKTCDEQILSVDEALKRIEDISKAAAQESSAS